MAHTILGVAAWELLHGPHCYMGCDHASMHKFVCLHRDDSASDALRTRIFTMGHGSFAVQRR